ncbi:MAG: MOSC domain-containing protein [SAR324 cluster bacterium]|nr:MOSC domain-containing protein [SAR324 cluster bacterium]
MRIVSLNVGLPRDVEMKRGTVATGIYKEPVPGRVMARKLNLDGDGQADLVGHGGEQRAVYAYPLEHYAHWRSQLGLGDMPHGQFGENLTCEGWLEDTVHIGDVFRAGDATLEVTQPRPPCFKLAHRMGRPDILKPFLSSGRVGFYLRVLEEGEIGAGDALERVSLGPEQMTVREICHLMYFGKDDLAGAERALRIPALSPGWLDSFAQRLQQQ